MRTVIATYCRVIKNTGVFPSINNVDVSNSEPHQTPPKVDNDDAAPSSLSAANGAASPVVRASTVDVNDTTDSSQFHCSDANPPVVEHASHLVNGSSLCAC